MKNFTFLLLVFSFSALSAVKVPDQNKKAIRNPEPANVSAKSSGAGRIYGLLDLRPSLTAQSAVLGSENTIEGGYQFNPNLRLTYTQWWNTTKGLYEGVYAHDGFFRLRVNNIFSEGNVSLNYQARVFLPTYWVRREAGFVGSIFNQLRLSVKVNPMLTLSVSTAPTFLYFSRSFANGKLNRLFENQANVSADIQFSNRLALTFPFFLISGKNQSEAGVAGSGDWSHQLLIWPELGFSINSNHTVGLSYYSSNLMTASLDGFNILQGLNNGAFQVFWTGQL